MKYLTIILAFISASACLKTTYIGNGYTKAAINPKVYSNNRFLFDALMLTDIDTAVLYEEYRTVYYSRS